MDDLAWFAAGVAAGFTYMGLGIGVTRTQKKFSLFVVFFWPIVLGVMAACGEIAE